MEQLSFKVNELEHRLAATRMEVREVREDVREIQRLLEAFLSNKEGSYEEIANTNSRRPNWAEASNERQIAAPTAIVILKDQHMEDETVKSPPLAGDNVTNIILVPAECAPWSKTGGLGDVAGALPKALARSGHRVMVVAPRYGNCVEDQETGAHKRYKVDGQDMEAAFEVLFCKHTRCILVIHNIAHRGRGPVHDFCYVDLPQNYFKLYDPGGGEHFNVLTAGLRAADRVVTISHGYAWELETKEGGWGLHQIINEFDWKLKGIVNVIDAIEGNP
uniref:Starch synthase catalytic domain-containing protein n=1 Tax=Nelumbo nucifera TaxID=4432 RepID=A0A822Z2Q9_NELNU|nr:TPA_asm: hypothetical protein HUJ06_013303 [Nelumbo nucifera]